MIYDIEGNKLLQNNLENKKISIIGDSYVSGYGENKKSDMWWYKIADRNGMVAVDLGSGGESLRLMVTATRYSNIPADSDYIVVFTGHNDTHYDYTPVGDDTDTDNTTFYGCLDILCKWLMNNRPTAKKLFITPTHRTQYDAIPYVNAMKEVCHRYGIPCWDSYGELDILIGGQEGVNQRNIFETANNTFHLNALGQDYLSYKAEAKLKQL